MLELSTAVFRRREGKRAQLWEFQRVAKSTHGTRKIQFLALFGLGYGLAILKIKIQVCSNPPTFFHNFKTMNWKSQKISHESTNMTFLDAVGPIAISLQFGYNDSLKIKGRSGTSSQVCGRRRYVQFIISKNTQGQKKTSKFSGKTQAKKSKTQYFANCRRLPQTWDDVPDLPFIFSN